MGDPRDIMIESLSRRIQVESLHILTVMLLTKEQTENIALELKARCVELLSKAIGKKQ